MFDMYQGSLIGVLEVGTPADEKRSPSSRWYELHMKLICIKSAKGTNLAPLIRF